jgi:hypothetical protein
MLRFVALAAAVLAVLVAALLWWWMLPPVAAASTLAAAASRAPAGVDGMVVLATPTRLERWLMRHRQAAALLLLAGPEAGRAMGRLEPVALACARASRGPLLLWWRGDGTAIQVEATAGGRRALAELAAVKGLVVAVAGDAITIADKAGALGPPGDRTPPAGSGRHAALALAGGRWWWVDASRQRLQAVTGAGANPPVAEATTVAVTAAAARLLGAAGRGIGGRVAILVTPRAGWSFWLPGVEPSTIVQRLFGERRRDGGASGEAHRLGGSFGEVWVMLDDGVALASSRELLSRVRALGGEGEYGAVRGADLARALDRIAGLVEDVPGMGRQGRELRRADEQLRGLDAARWRLGGRGGTIIMEW